MSTRRSQLAEVVRGSTRKAAGPLSLQTIYETVEAERPDLADNEHDQWGLKWRHEVRWEVETLVTQGTLRRRKDLGRGMYSL